MHRTLGTYSKNGKMCNYNKWFSRIFSPQKVLILSFDAKTYMSLLKLHFFTVFRALCAFTPGGQVAHMEMWK